MKQRYETCPMCEGKDHAVMLTVDCKKHTLWHEPLPETLTWLQCKGCRHVYTDSFYTPAGLAELFKKSNPGQIAGGQQIDNERVRWAPVVQAVEDILGLSSEDRSWLDVGFGSGGLIMTAAEFGYYPAGLDTRVEAVEALSALGYTVELGDFSGSSGPWDAISLCDVLEHTEQPMRTLRMAAERLADRGVLYVSCPNRDSASWLARDKDGTNPFWCEIEHYHNFSRESLMDAMRQVGLEPVRYGVSNRYVSSMEIWAVKR